MSIFCESTLECIVYYDILALVDDLRSRLRLDNGTAVNGDVCYKSHTTPGSTTDKITFTVYNPILHLGTLGTNIIDMHIVLVSFKVHIITPIGLAYDYTERSQAIVRSV